MWISTELVKYILISRCEFPASSPLNYSFLRAPWPYAEQSAAGQCKHGRRPAHCRLRFPAESLRVVKELGLQKLSVIIYCLYIRKLHGIELFHKPENRTCEPKIKLEHMYICSTGEKGWKGREQGSEGERGGALSVQVFAAFVSMLTEYHPAETMYKSHLRSSH